MNKFEKVSTLDHQMSVLVGDGWVGPVQWGNVSREPLYSEVLCPMGARVRAGEPCTVRSNASWVMAHGILSPVGGGLMVRWK